MTLDAARLRRTWRRLSRRARRSELLLGLLILVVATVLILSLPVLLPVVAVLEARDRRRLRAAADAFACLECGEILGLAALERADADWAGHLARLHREHPGCRFRLVRDVHAVCTRCGARYRFDEKSAIFT